MGHADFGRHWARQADQWAREAEASFRQNAGSWSEWVDPTCGPRGSRGAHHGPPPWVAGLFGLQQRGQQRGPRVRRGDVRSAILDVLRAAGEAGEALNGYQVIQQIADRSRGEWRPSPGSVYPTIQQLEDEGLVENDEERGRRSLRLTTAGWEYAEANAAELETVWAPFDREHRAATPTGGVDLKGEIGQVMSAVWQIVSSGSDTQRRAAVEVLVEARRKLYGILADGHTGPARAEDDRAEDDRDGTDDGEQA